MASVVGICNRALALVGEDAITSLSEDSEPARRCNLMYADTRDAVLRDHPWNAAITRAELAALSEAPAFGFAYQYQLPADPYCLRVLGLEDDGAIFRVEGRRLLSDSGDARIRYIARIIDPGEFDALLLDTIAARLAADLAYSLVQSNALAQAMWQLYLSKLAAARKADGQEGTPERITASEWLEGRR